MASGGAGTVHVFDVDNGKNLPAHIITARSEIGTREYIVKDGRRVPNQKVATWIYEVTGERVNPTTVPWCAYYVGHCLEKGGMVSTKSGMARSYLKWGEEIEYEDAKPGDVVVTWRGRRDDGITGHVFFFLEHTADGVRGIGGNQGDSVSIQDFGHAKLLGIRRYRTAGRSRTVRSAITGGVADITRNVVEAAVPDAIPRVTGKDVVNVIEQSKEPLEILAQVKPWITSILACVTLLGILLAVYYRVEDHSKGKNA